MIGTTEAFIIDAVRTPVGKSGGVLQDVRLDDMSALVIRKPLERTKIDPALIDDVMWGCANQAGEDNRNVGRMEALFAGLPYSVPADKINPLCGSSLDAINSGLPFRSMYLSQLSKMNLARSFPSTQFCRF